MNDILNEIYKHEYRKGNEIIQEMSETTKSRTKYPILLIRGIANIGKTTFMNELCRQNRIRLNLHSTLRNQKISLSQELMDKTISRTDVLSLFEKNPKPIFYGFKHIERIITYEKSTYRSLIQYLKSVSMDACRPIIILLTEPMNTQKYQDLMNYVGYTIELTGFSKEWLVSYLFTHYQLSRQYALTYFDYICRDFRRFRQVIRELEKPIKKKTLPVLFHQAKQPTFLEINERNTMKQRLQLYFDNIGSSMPEQIQQWSTMLQETELATMGQTIHETIFEHFNSYDDYEKYLKIFMISNEFQLLQHLYNRHAIEPYWIYAMIYVPFLLGKPHRSTVKFTKLLTRSSIQSNYRKFIETIACHKPMYDYMNEFETLENPVQKWVDDGISSGDARRLYRSFQRMKHGGLS